LFVAFGKKFSAFLFPKGFLEMGCFMRGVGCSSAGFWEIGE
jgi:hypothetical protein